MPQMFRMMSAEHVKPYQVGMFVVGMSDSTVRGEVHGCGVNGRK